MLRAIPPSLKTACEQFQLILRQAPRRLSGEQPAMAAPDTHSRPYVPAQVRAWGVEGGAAGQAHAMTVAMPRPHFHSPLPHAQDAAPCGPPGAEERRLRVMSYNILADVLCQEYQRFLYRNQPRSTLAWNRRLALLVRCGGGGSGGSRGAP